MSTDTRNSFDLFDAPVRSSEKQLVAVTLDELTRQLEAGAFVMDREEAIKTGFINPDNEPDAGQDHFKKLSLRDRHEDQVMIK